MLLSVKQNRHAKTMKNFKISFTYKTYNGKTKSLANSDLGQTKRVTRAMTKVYARKTKKTWRSPPLYGPCILMVCQILITQRHIPSFPCKKYKGKKKKAGAKRKLLTRKLQAFGAKRKLFTRKL